MAASALCLLASGCASPRSGAAPAAGASEPPAKDPIAAPAWVRTDSKVRIRLHNLSDSLPLTDVRVKFPSDSARIEFIGPGSYSPYFAVDSAYRYAFIQAVSGGRNWFCQPVDFTGETLLAPGRYTYDLSQVRNRDPDAAMGFFLVELIEDKGHP